jgi:hypothetical protein
MTMDRWLILLIAAFGAVQLLLLRVFVFGRWAQQVEHPAAFSDLRHAIDRLTEQVGELRDLFHGRYTALDQRQLADHKLVRDLEREFHTWQAEVTVRMSERLKEYETTRTTLLTTVEMLKVRCLVNHGDDSDS